MNKKPHSNSKVHQPHDSICRKLLSSPKMAWSVICNSFPAFVIDELDKSTLQRVNASFATEDLGQLHSDIIYEVKTVAPQKTKYYFLIEFQAKAEKFMPIRMSVYAGQLLLDYLKKHKNQAEPLPIILPLVIYNGRCGYNEARTIFSLYPGHRHKLLHHTISGNFWLEDFRSMRDKKLLSRSGPFVSLGLALKYVKHPKIKKFFKKIMNDMESLDDGIGGFGKAMLKYLIYGGCLDGEFFEEWLESSYVSEKMRSNAMSIVEKYTQLGERRGERRGELRGTRRARFAMAKNCLAAGMPVKQIANLTELSIEDIQALTMDTAV